MLQPLFIWSDYSSLATVTATDTKAGLVASDILEAEEDNVWAPLNTIGAKSVTIDLGAPQEIGSLGMVGDYLAGVSLEIRASTDNFSSSNIQISAAATMADYLTHYRLFANDTYQYWRLTIQGYGPSFNIAHVALCRQALMPWMDDGFDADGYASEGSALISPDGRFLGASKLRTMRTIAAKWGQISAGEYIAFARWADASIKNLRPFFFVPDSGDDLCHFCWCDVKQKFTAPMENSLRDIGTITMTARMV